EHEPPRIGRIDEQRVIVRCVWKPRRGLAATATATAAAVEGGKREHGGERRQAGCSRGVQPPPPRRPRGLLGRLDRPLPWRPVLALRSHFVPPSRDRHGDARTGSARGGRRSQKRKRCNTAGE